MAADADCRNRRPTRRTPDLADLLLLSILFHHSNVELPIDVERLVARLVVTPRIHGIHHSSVPEERIRTGPAF